MTEQIANVYGADSPPDRSIQKECVWGSGHLGSQLGFVVPCAQERHQTLRFQSKGWVQRLLIKKNVSFLASPDMRLMHITDTFDVA